MTRVSPAERIRQNLPEIGRLPDGKVYRSRNGKKRVIKTLGLVHYERDGRLEEISLSPVKRGNVVVVDEAPYTLTANAAVGFEYISRRGGKLSMKLIKTDDAVFNRTVEPEIHENEIWWRGVSTDLDVCLRVSSTGVRVLKILRSKDAPHKITWGIEEDAVKGFHFQDRVTGKSTGGLHLKMNWHRENETATQTGIKYDFVEEAEGSVSTVLNRVTRIKTWLPLTDAHYPLEIDPTIQETIVDTADDGNSNAVNGNMYTTSNLVYVGTSGGEELVGGTRFRVVNIPQGATVTSATLTTFTKVTSNSTGTVYGDDVDSAPTWQTTNERMHQITKTTASANYTPSTDETTEVTDVTGIVQEVVNRSGWASGNDMRFSFFAGTITGAARFSDLSLGDGNEAILDVEFVDTAIKDVIGYGVVPFPR